MTPIELTVQGMTCDHCVRAVQAEIAGVAGVAAVAVDLASGRVEVTPVEGVAVDGAALRAAVGAAGYTIAD